jgi:hypothetical protein
MLTFAMPLVTSEITCVTTVHGDVLRKSSPLPSTLSGRKTKYIDIRKRVVIDFMQDCISILAFVCGTDNLAD